MKVTVLSARNLPSALAALWWRWQVENPSVASPYFHPEFTRCVAATRADTFVAVIDDGAAFFPFQRGRFGVGRAAGGVMSDYHGVIALPDFTWDPLELVRKCELRAWDFDHLPAAQTAFVPWHAARVSSPVLDLTRGGSFGSAQWREQARRRRRQMERDFGAVEFAMHTDDVATLRQVMTWKSAQYRRTGVHDLFAQHWAVEVLNQIHAAQEGADFCGVLGTLRAGGRLVAAHFGMRSRGVLHYWFPAYDAAMSDYSPGTVLLSEMITAAPAHGLAQIDFGKGDQRYKQQLANTAVPLAEGSVIASPWLAAARCSRAKLERWVRASPLRPLARTIRRKL